MHRSAVAHALGGMLALAAGMGIGRFVYTPILPAMVEGLGLTTGQAGLIASLNFVGYLAGALAAAASRLAEQRRRCLLAGLAVNALAMAAMGLTTSLPAFLLLRFMAGVASAFILVFATALVLDQLARIDRGSLAAVHFGGVGVGIAASAALVAGLLATGVAWSGLWLASAALAAAAGLAAAWLVPPSHAAPAPASGTDGSANGPLRRLTVAYGLFGFGYVVTATFLVAIVRAEPQIAAFEPAVWIMVGLTAAPSVALWGWLGQRLGLAPAFALACFVEAAGVVASVLWPALAGVVLAATCLGGTFMGITALGLVMARNLAEGDPRRVLALMTGAFGLGQIVGPTFAGFLDDRTGTFLIASLAAALALVAAALIAGLGLPSGARQGQRGQGR